MLQTPPQKNLKIKLLVFNMPSEYSIANIFFVVVFLFCFSIVETIAQKVYEPWRRYEKTSQIEFGIGTSNYLGDIHPIDNIYSYQSSIRWNTSLSYIKQITPFYSLKIAFSWVRLAGDDYVFTKNQVSKTDNFDINFLRNLSFRNDLKEVSYVSIINLKSGFFARNFKNRPQMIPYFLLGTSLIKHQPLAREIYTQTIGLGEWRKINVSQSKRNIAFAIPTGIGLKGRVSEKFDLNFELNYHFVFTDNLDDIIGRPFPKNELIGNTDFTNRSTEKFTANNGFNRTNLYNIVAQRQGFSFFNGLGTNLFPTIGYPNTTPERGDKKNDSFLMISVKVQYYLSKRDRCKY